MIFTDQPESPCRDKLSMTFTQKTPNRRVYDFCRCQMPRAAALGVAVLRRSGLGFRSKPELPWLPWLPGMLVFAPDNLQASTGPISIAGVGPIERVKEG